MRSKAIRVFLQAPADGLNLHLYGTPVVRVCRTGDAVWADIKCGSDNVGLISSEVEAADGIAQLRHIARAILDGCDKIEAHDVAHAAAGGAS